MGVARRVGGILQCHNRGNHVCAHAVHSASCETAVPFSSPCKMLWSQVPVPRCCPMAGAAPCPAPSHPARRSPSGCTSGRERRIFPLLLPCQIHGDLPSICALSPAPASLMWEMGTVAAVPSQKHFRNRSWPALLYALPKLGKGKVPSFNVGAGLQQPLPNPARTQPHGQPHLPQAPEYFYSFFRGLFF